MQQFSEEGKDPSCALWHFCCWDCDDKLQVIGLSMFSSSISLDNRIVENNNIFCCSRAVTPQIIIMTC